MATFSTLKTLKSKPKGSSILAVYPPRAIVSNTAFELDNKKCFALKYTKQPRDV